MTKEGWANVVTGAMNDPEKLDLLARLLEEQDRAKHLLRDAGFGVTGQSLLLTVQEIIHRYFEEIERQYQI